MIEPFKSSGFDTDSIYHKEVTGCGFTTFGIEYLEENFVGMLPNRPVIEDKVREHNMKYPDKPILGVYKGISIAQIKACLMNATKLSTIAQDGGTRSIYTLNGIAFILVDFPPGLQGPDRTFQVGIMTNNSNR